MVGSSSLSPDVEKLITDPEVLRVLRLFISLGRTDIIKFLNETVNQDPKEVQNALDAVYFFVKRGLQIQRYLTSQMRTDAEPSEWPYDPNEESSSTSAERQLVDKYPDTGLKYRAWNTVNICPPDRRLWDRNSKAYESQRFCAYSRLQFVIFHPGLVDLAFLEQGDSKEIGTRVATRAVRHYGLGYVPTKGIESRSRSLSNVSRKKTGAEKEERERSRDKHRQEHNQNPPRDNRDRRSSLTRSESHEQQRQESKRNTVEARAPAKKLDNGKKAEARLPAKKSSRKNKKPAAKTDPSSSRTGGSGAVSQSHR
ncbi:hypothetical protein BOTCAL_0004g00040 [Botryotinia calthae]|uniref:Uncharacterized protein n=1 Tax=Botryotinia calthae TaxID=38488 RepID=A0A4Y8DJM5_9HELO|nr:hypothetical protein BOTCAL_0004g00040 [Botryotinia calthae]